MEEYTKTLKQPGLNISENVRTPLILKWNSSFWKLVKFLAAFNFIVCMH